MAHSGLVPQKYLTNTCNGWWHSSDMLSTHSSKLWEMSDSFPFQTCRDWPILSLLPIDANPYLKWKSGQNMKVQPKMNGLKARFFGASRVTSRLKIEASGGKRHIMVGRTCWNNTCYWIEWQDREQRWSLLVVPCQNQWNSNNIDVSTKYIFGRFFVAVSSRDLPNLFRHLFRVKNQFDWSEGTEFESGRNQVFITRFLFHRLDLFHM